MSPSSPPPVLRRHRVSFILATAEYIARRLREKPSPLGKEQIRIHLLRNWISVSVIMRLMARQIDYNGTLLAFKPTRNQCDPLLLEAMSSAVFHACRTFGVSMGIRRMKLTIFSFPFRSPHQSAQESDNRCRHDMHAGILSIRPRFPVEEIREDV